MHGGAAHHMRHHSSHPEQGLLLLSTLLWPVPEVLRQRVDTSGLRPHSLRDGFTPNAETQIPEEGR